MKLNRFFLKFFNAFIYLLSVVILTSVSCFITLITFALIEPLSSLYGLALFFMIASIVPAIMLTNKMAIYFKNKQVRSTAESFEETCSDPLEYTPDTEPTKPDQDPETQKEWDPADDIPDIVQHEWFSDTLFLEAVDVILETKVVSAGRLQSSLKIGSKRAVEILNEMEELGVIGPAIGNRPREIFFTPEEWKTERKRFEWCPKPPDEPEFTMHKSQTAPIAVMHQSNNAANCKCMRCGSNHISFETFTEKDTLGCFPSGLCFLLMLVMFGVIIGFFVGIIVVCILSISRTKAITYATCQDCGMRWRTS